VAAIQGRYKATCDTPPCHHNNLGICGTPEEAAQASLQHQQHTHSHHPVTDTWFQCDDCNKWRRFAGDLGEEEQWCCKDSGGLYTCEDEEEVSEEGQQSTAVPGHRDVVGMQGEAITSQGTAGSNMNGSKQRMKNDHPEEREKDRAPQGHHVQGGGKKRKHEHTSEVERPSEQLLTDNEALKQEFIEEDDAVFQQIMSAVEAVAQCSICFDTMKQASTVSGCGHTFCHSCIEEALRVKGCCPQCHLPAWRRDIRPARRLNGVMEVVGVKL
jgi:hypothetical protein